MSDTTINHIFSQGFVAEEKVYGQRFVVLGTDPLSQVKMPGAGNVIGVGVVVGDLDEEFDIGESVSVLILGKARCKAGAAVNAGDRVEITDAQGDVIPCAGAGNHNSVGIAFTTCDADGEVIEVLLTPGAQVNIA